MIGKRVLVDGAYGTVDSFYVEEGFYSIVMDDGTSCGTTISKDFIKEFLVEEGVKLSPEKAPIFTYCNQFKNAIEQLALRSKYGHDKYKETDADWRNFARVPNADFEYSNAQFRHALGLGNDEESELDHLTASAWNAVARLQIYLEKQ
jgi:Domain of unknown function (DUF5664)